MNKILSCLILASLAGLCGCSTLPPTPMGKDEFTIVHTGSTLTTISSLKIQCLQEANQYCEQRGLAMVVVSTSGHDGSFWASKRAECELVFLAVPPNDPRNKPTNAENVNTNK